MPVIKTLRVKDREYEIRENQVGETYKYEVYLDNKIFNPDGDLSITGKVESINGSKKLPLGDLTPDLVKELSIRLRSKF